eukprot:scaffold114743_cov19-Tisochrysis_lutea.AAC.2
MLRLLALHSFRTRFVPCLLCTACASRQLHLCLLSKPLQELLSYSHLDMKCLNSNEKNGHSSTHSLVHFKCSAAIFKWQIERTGLDKNLGDLAGEASAAFFILNQARDACFALRLAAATIYSQEIVYIDAPNPASGPVPRDVRPFFGDGPFFEWTTVQEMGDQFGGSTGLLSCLLVCLLQAKNSAKRAYSLLQSTEFDVEKLERSVSQVEKVLREEGPFDGLVGFSQGTLLASVIVMLQHRGLILQ